MMPPGIYVMRIIDKQQDYYDYLQTPDDKLVFDRRGSYLLTKKMICERWNNVRSYKDSVYRFFLLQCGASFWLFLATGSGFGDDEIPSNYELELLAGWKNYDKPRALLKFDMISFQHFFWFRSNVFLRYLEYDKITDHIDDMRDAIDHKDFYIGCSLDDCCKPGESRSYPLLKACGVGSIVDPVEMFCAVEEHFSLEKTAGEMTEPIGVTNDDKIVMHGFDTKSSFRGKNN